MLYSIGRGDEILDMLADTAISKGEMIEELEENFIRTVRNLEGRLRKETGDPTSES